MDLKLPVYACFCFNNCLFMLFKFKIEPEEENEISNENVTNFNNKLQQYGLFTFQHRLLNKILTFTHNIINNPNSPSELKSILRPENINNIPYVDLDASIKVMVLRSNRRIRNSVENSNKFNQLTFSYFFLRLKKIFINANFYLPLNLFKSELIVNMNSNFNKFISNFSKFNIDYKHYNFNAKKFRKFLNQKKKKNT